MKSSSKLFSFEPTVNIDYIDTLTKLPGVALDKKTPTARACDTSSNFGSAITMTSKIIKKITVYKLLLFNLN